VQIKATSTDEVQMLSPVLIDIISIAHTTTAREFVITPINERSFSFCAVVDGVTSVDKDDLMLVAVALLQAAHKLTKKIAWSGLIEDNPDWQHIALED
jgi:hypothetical protein